MRAEFDADSLARFEREPRQATSPRSPRRRPLDDTSVSPNTDGQEIIAENRLDIDIYDSDGLDAAAMQKPVLVWDADCGFCKRAVIHLAKQVGQCIRYAPFQHIHCLFEDIDARDFAQAVYFIEPDRSTYTGAEAIFRAYSWRPPGSLLLGLYHRVPGFASVSEWGYRRVANHRELASRLARLVPGW